MRLETRDFGEYEFHPYAVFRGIESAIPTSLTTSSPFPERREASTSSGGQAPERWDVVVITTKALPDQSPTDAEAIAPLVSPGHTAILLIQNGVGIEAPIRERFPTNVVLTGVTVVSAVQTSPGVIKQNRWTRLHLGPYGVNFASRQDFPSGRSEQEDKNLRSRGIELALDLARWWGSDPSIPLHDRPKQREEDTTTSTFGRINDVQVLSAMEIQCVRWHKLATNASFNPTAVLCGGRGNADMIQDPELRAHVKGVMEEVLSAAPLVLDLKGGKLPDSLGLAEPERILRSTERNVGAKPSMLLDWEGRKKIETEAILGNAVRMARANGVSMPRCETMYALLKSAEAMRGRL